MQKEPTKEIIKNGGQTKKESLILSQSHINLEDKKNPLNIQTTVESESKNPFSEISRTDAVNALKHLSSLHKPISKVLQNEHTPAILLHTPSPSTDSSVQTAIKGGKNPIPPTCHICHKKANLINCSVCSIAFHFSCICTEKQGETPTNCLCPSCK